LYASDELVEDCDTLDIVSFIVGLFSEVIGEEEDRVIWRGNGTTQPTGVVTARAAGTVATRTAAAGLTFDEVIDLVYDLPGKYHKNAKLWVHRHNIRDMRKLKDSQNRYYWQEPVAAGQPSTFYGYPVIEANELPDDEIYFGDMKKAYWFGDRAKMTVKITQDTETAFTKDQTAIRHKSGTRLKDLVKNAANCWDILFNRTISNQAIPVMV
jgi:HK97 family phage major capsid protein